MMNSIDWYQTNWKHTISGFFVRFSKSFCFRTWFTRNISFRLRWNTRHAFESKMLFATCDTRDMTTKKANEMIIEDRCLTVIAHFANTYGKIRIGSVKDNFYLELHVWYCSCHNELSVWQFVPLQILGRIFLRNSSLSVTFHEYQAIKDQALAFLVFSISVNYLKKARKCNKIIENVPRRMQYSFWLHQEYQLEWKACNTILDIVLHSWKMTLSMHDALWNIFESNLRSLAA